jgi:hypothetical protein
VNWRRRCGGVFGGCYAEAERGKNGDGGCSDARGRRVRGGGRGLALELRVGQRHQPGSGGTRCCTAWGENKGGERYRQVGQGYSALV